MKTELLRRLSALKGFRQGHCRTISTLAIMLALCITLIFLVSCGKDSSSQKASENVNLKAVKNGSTGQALIASRCSTCHNTDRIKKARKTKEEWEQTVNRMAVKGAKLSKEEKVILADFLAMLYKP